MSGRAFARSVSLGAVAALLGACGWFGGGGGGTAAKPHAIHAGRARRPAHRAGAEGAAEAADTEMVAAVSAGKTTLPVQLKFALQERPEVGQPVRLRLALIPTAPVTRMTATFHTDEGLQLSSGTQLATVQNPPKGVAVMHTLTLLPQRSGIFSVMGVVLADSAGTSVAHKFQIPVIVGAGLAVSAAGSPTSVAQSSAAAPGSSMAVAGSPASAAGPSAAVAD